MRALRLPSWLRRGLEAGIIAALVSIITLLGSTGGGSAVVLPEGAAGSLLLGPSVLALGVITVGYPIAYAATRADAVLGAVTAFLLGANLVALVVSTPAQLGGLGRTMALGVLVGVLALGPVVVGLAAAQLSSRLGFGRRAGAASAVASGGVAVMVLILASRLG